jgi:cytochrome c oxidase assembly protein subunit 11
MVGLAYASVPLYRIFCQVTGYGGTTQRAEIGSDVILDREMKVRFDANTAGIDWDFAPVETEIRVKVGETRLAFYEATNHASHTVTGTATFNVTPLQAGAYFNKIDCFCFTEQTLKAGETAQMPVSFYIDPAIADDPEMDGVGTITLSYTFFETETPDTGDDLALQPPASTAAAVN